MKRLEVVMEELSRVWVGQNLKALDLSVDSGDTLSLKIVNTSVIWAPVWWSGAISIDGSIAREDYGTLRSVSVSMMRELYVVGMYMLERGFKKQALKDAVKNASELGCLLDSNHGLYEYEPGVWSCYHHAKTRQELAADREVYEDTERDEYDLSWDEDLIRGCDAFVYGDGNVPF